MQISLVVNVDIIEYCKAHYNKVYFAHRIDDS